MGDVGLPGSLPGGLDDDAAAQQLLAAKELLRLDILRSPVALARGLDPHYRMRPHLRVIGEAMAGLERGDYDRLLIVTPPQVGKSASVAEWGPFWWLCLHPRDNVAITSYSDDLALRRGKAVKEYIEAHGDEYDLHLKPGSSAAHDYGLTSGGGVRSVSVGSGLTGFSVNLLAIDDPHKDRADAESARSRQRVHDWYSSTALKRLQPDRNAVVVIMCTLASMRVLRGDGRWARVDEITPGDTVVSLAEDRISLRTAKVTAARLSGHDATYTVRTDRLSLTVNGRHPFAVVNRTGVRGRADDVKWVRADELKPGDLVVTVKSLPDDHAAADALPNGWEVTPEIAWLLGYLLGDGWVTAHKRRNQVGNPTSYAVCVAVCKSRTPEKEGLQERVHAALSSFSPNRVYTTGFGYLRTDWNEGGRLLHSMGYGGRAKGKRVPDCVWGWSPGLRRAFIEGYVYADGAKQRMTAGTRAWRVVSVNRALLQDIRDLALTCGVRPTTVFSDRERTYQPPNSPKPVTSVLHSLGLTFNPEEPEGRTHLTGYRHPAPRHIRYEKVRSIEHDPTPQPVYDLTVEGTESFCAEGFIVHNTRWHPEDLAGRRLAEEGRLEEGGRWKVVHLPAIADPRFGPDPLGRAPGDPLTHPKIPTRDRAALLDWWEDMKRTSIVRDWHALGQGDPQPAEGALVSAELLRLIRSPGDHVTPQKIAVAVDPSGGGRDAAGVVGGFLGDDGRVWVTHDRSGVMSSADWSTAACRLAFETDAAVVFVENNYGGDMCELAIQTSWETLQREGEIPDRKLPPMVKTVRAKVGKLLRAEPIAHQMVQDRVRLRGVFTDLEYEWSHWMPTDPDSPGRIDASVYLVYGLLPDSGGGAVLHAPLPQRPVQPGGGAASVYGRRLS